MKIKPCGYFVLVDVTPVAKVTDWGFELTDDTVSKEQTIKDTGRIIAIGPAAYIGMRGCTEEDMARTGLPAHKLWGVDVGDVVEFRKYEGKVADSSQQEGMSYMRYIPDTHIMGVINDD